jgi:hypothetical protein
MPKKKSTKLAAKQFVDAADAILAYAHESARKLGVQHTTWAYEYAIIHLYRSFEQLVLHALVAAINNDTETISEVTGYNFPKHIPANISLYLIVGSGYFDFRGRSGLIGELRRYVPADHFLVETVKDGKYKQPLERLIALRTFAAHDSELSKKAAKKATGMKGLGSAGSWLKRQDRFDKLVRSLKSLAAELDARAPY